MSKFFGMCQVFANMTVLWIGPVAVCFEMWVEVVVLKHCYVELVNLVLW